MKSSVPATNPLRLVNQQFQRMNQVELLTHLQINSFNPTEQDLQQISDSTGRGWPTFIRNLFAASAPQYARFQLNYRTVWGSVGRCDLVTDERDLTFKLIARAINTDLVNKRTNTVWQRNQTKRQHSQLQARGNQARKATSTLVLLVFGILCIQAFRLVRPANAETMDLFFAYANGFALGMGFLGGSLFVYAIRAPKAIPYLLLQTLAWLTFTWLLAMLISLTGY